ncbi:46c836e4-0b56-4a0e-9e3f-d025cc3f91ed [Sclerotinia trifoliorum]|uniref:46c836e4-0b56-4a0e-9e3f-d025cc3f91ed n=1 Tax=Sclerotinia trifoliorum TaxID=28548 RepID=A0A8H2W006_9HELO|nr:46c836e4-0b56-4a0e-9e3f-d025cc3f91ed [Sclerotinia trifoliorum]
MALDEWDAETFDMALQWMYSGNVIISKSSKPFDQVRSYIQFFKIVKALELDGSLQMVEQNLKNTLIAAAEKEDDEDGDAFNCNSTFKEVL